MEAIAGETSRRGLLYCEERSACIPRFLPPPKWARPCDLVRAQADRTGRTQDARNSQEGGRERFVKYILLTLAVAVGVALMLELVRALRTYLKFRGKRIVSCPETHQAAGVRVAAGKAALQATAGAPDIRLSECSRWPEKEACGQECLAQIKEAPKACLVSTIVNQWYAGQSCAYCKKPFGEVHWHDHPPALVDQERKTIPWSDVSIENLQQVLATHGPVCWSCHITETFRREHPEIVVNRLAH